MFEQTFKNIDDILHKDAGCGSELDYIEQTSWILFLKYLNDLEIEKKTAAQLSGKAYNEIISSKLKWKPWGEPKNAKGKLNNTRHLQVMSLDLELIKKSTKCHICTRTK